MKLYIEGDIGRYYVQTLCLIFFPGSKFPEDEEADEQTDVVSVKLESEAEFYKATAEIHSGSRHSRGTACEALGGIDTDERIKKRAVGKAVYKAGTEFFDFSPDWGILTGVRPVKLADELMIKAAEALSRNHCKSNGQNNSESLTDVYLGCTEVSRTAEEILIRDY